MGLADPAPLLLACSGAMLLVEAMLAAALTLADGAHGAPPDSRAGARSTVRAAASPRARGTGTARRQASPAAVRARARIVAAARRQVGRQFRGDCSAFVLRVFREAKVPVPDRGTPAASTSEAIFRSLPNVRRPRPGDVVVFHRTYDREKPGPGRNLFTHVGIVESVAGQRVTFIHRSGKGVQRSTMNLARPGDPRENDTLRRRRVADRPSQRYLAGELFAGYASAVGGDLRVARTGDRLRARSTEPPPARGNAGRTAP